MNIEAIFSDLYYRSKRVGSTKDYLENYYNYYDRLSSIQLNFYWIGYGHCASGISKNDIAGVGSHGIRFESDVYTNEFIRMKECIKTKTKLEESGLNFIILLEKVTSLNSLKNSRKIIINLNDPIFIDDRFREEFLDLLIEIANIIEANHNYDSGTIKSRINYFIQSQTHYYYGKRYGKYFINGIKFMFDKLPIT